MFPFHSSTATSPLLTPPSSSRPNKVASQRQYREREGMYFNTLRDTIKQLTGERLHTREEVLKKAIDLLSPMSGTRLQIESQVEPLASSTIDSQINPASSGTISSFPDHSSHWNSSHSHHNWYSNASYAGPFQLHGQLNHSNGDYRMDNINYDEYDEEFQSRESYNT